MNGKLIKSIVTAAALSVSGLAVGMQGDPIPGVDVSLEQSPGSVMKVVKNGSDGGKVGGFTPGANVKLTQGGITKMLKADKNGFVQWSSDTAGTAGSPAPQAGRNYNSGRSNTSGL